MSPGCSPHYYRGWVNGSGFYQEAIVTTDVKTPDGMVYDWVSQILYWSDTAMTHIQVSDDSISDDSINHDSSCNYSKRMLII